MNLCVSCGEDFGSVSAFDRHRVGDHNIDIKDDPHKGRRCLDPEEYAAADLVKNKKGTWSISKDLDRARRINDKSKRVHAKP